MAKRFILFIHILALFFGFILLPCHGVQIKGAEENPILGPQSRLAKGEIPVLRVAVRFPDGEPRFACEPIRKKAVIDLDRYVREQSYGLG